MTVRALFEKKEIRLRVVGQAEPEIRMDLRLNDQGAGQARSRILDTICSQGGPQAAPAPACEIHLRL